MCHSLVPPRYWWPIIVCTWIGHSCFIFVLISPQRGLPIFWWVNKEAHYFPVMGFNLMFFFSTWGKSLFVLDAHNYKVLSVIPFVSSQQDNRHRLILAHRTPMCVTYFSVLLGVGIFKHVYIIQFPRWVPVFFQHFVSFSHRFDLLHKEKCKKILK